MHENAGIAFVSFKDKECVTETIDEIDLVKTKLVGKEYYDALGIPNWEVETAIPTNDIIWTELNKGNAGSFIKNIIMNLGVLLLSATVIFGVIYVD